MLRSSSLVSRASALAILAIVTLAVIQLLIQPIVMIFKDNRKEAAELEAILQKYKQLIAERPKVIERLDAFSTGGQSFKFYLESTSEALAEAELQDLVLTVVESAGGQVKSVQVLSNAADHSPELKKNSVKIHFSADVDTLTEAIYALESIEPFLIIDWLKVSVVIMHESEEEQQVVPELDVLIGVSGYARRPEATRSNKTADTQ